MQDVGAVREVSEAGYPSDGWQQEGCDEHQKRDSKGSQGEDVPGATDPAGQQRDCPHEVCMLLEPAEVEVDSGADEEEGELARKLDGKRVVPTGIKGHTVDERQEKAAAERPDSPQATAKPDQNGDEEVKQDFHLDGPKSSVDGGKIVVDEDAGQVGKKKGGKAKVGADVLPGGGGG